MHKVKTTLFGKNKTVEQLLKLAETKQAEEFKEHISKLDLNNEEFEALRKEIKMKLKKLAKDDLVSMMLPFVMQLKEKLPKIETNPLPANVAERSTLLYFAELQTVSESCNPPDAGWSSDVWKSIYPIVKQFSDEYKQMYVLPEKKLKDLIGMLDDVQNRRIYEEMKSRHEIIRGKMQQV